MSSISQPLISRRRVLAGLATLPIGAIVVACSGGSSSPAAPTQAAQPAPTSAPAAQATAASSAAPAAAPAATVQPASGAKVKVVFLSWGDAVRQKVRTDLTNQFNAKHPNIQADWQVIPAGTTFQAKLLTEIAGNIAPDIFMHAPTDLIHYATENIAFNTSTMIATDKYDLSDYPPKALEQLQFESKQYAFPQDFPTRGMFFNRTLFTQAGITEPPGDYKDETWTWERFIEASTKLTKSSNGRTSQFGYSTGYVMRQWAPWIYTNGGEWLNADLTKCTITDAPCVEALQFLQDLTYKYKVATNPGDLQEQNGMSMFSTGRVGMIEAIPGQIDSVEKEIKGFDWDCTHFPKGKGSYACTGGGSCYAMYAKTPHPDETWQFFTFADSPEAQLAHVKVGATFPSRYSVYKAYLALYKGKPPAHLQMFIDAQPFLRLDPQTDNWNEIDVAIQKQMDLLTNGKQTGKQVAQLIKDAVDPLLAKAKYRKPRA
ncbi:MAG TPA: sugar ABC transporter substrate-binding protein [Chloroflexota bacterium]|nr:sugar ABC transporter substrate-binding protein [Chloroflexota bacterium]